MLDFDNLLLGNASLKFEKIFGNLLKFGKISLISFFHREISVTIAANIRMIGKYIGTISNDNIANVFFEIIGYL